MKHRIFILSLAIITISLSAYGFVNWKDVKAEIEELESKQAMYTSYFDFAYSVQPRFLNTVTKEKVDKALSIHDIVPKSEYDDIKSYTNILVTAFAEARKDWIQVRGTNEYFDDAQIEMLKSFGYGSSFSITGNIRKYDASIGEIVNDTLIYYLTVMPDQATAYKNGHDDLIIYLREQSADAVSIAAKDKIQPGKISFTVTTEGSIEKVNLKSTSGYDSIDEKMLMLIREIPGSWEIARNAKGDQVSQELFFFFGSMGC